MLVPYPYQEVAIARAVERNFLCADKCGLGKTLVGIETAKRVQETHHHPVLVICTLSAVLQWMYAIKEQSETAYIKPLRALANFEIAMEGEHASHTLDWYIIHYAALRNMDSDHPLARTYFSTIIADEAHRIKNRRAQQTKGVKQLVSYRKLALTATEMERSPADMWSILNWLYPEKFRGYWGFRSKFVEVEKHPYFGWEKDVGVKNPDKLAELLHPIYIKRYKEDVREDMPPLTESRVPVDMFPRLLGAYTDIKTGGDILRYVGETELLVKNTLSEIMLLRQLTSNGASEKLPEPLPSAKMQWVLDYLSDNPDEKIAVFSVFRATAIQLADKLNAPLVIGGEETPDLQSTRPSIVVGTIRALGESHDLPWIDTAIFVDSDWSSIAMEQARDRIHRINITSPKHVIYLYHPDTVDELVFEALDNKWTNIEIVQRYIQQYVGKE